jgi:hypothetical protein
MADYSTFRRGAVTYPLTTSLTNSALQDADPVLFYVLDFLSAMITTYVGPRFMATVGTSAALTALITKPVAYRIPYDPSPYLTDNQFKFPLFAAWRQKETFRGRTTTWHMSETLVGLNYVLPPVNAAQAELLLPFLNAVSQVIDDRVENGFDPSYTPPGGNAGDVVWADTGVEQVRMVEGSWGTFTQTNSDLVFPAWQGTIMLKERAEKVTLPNTFSKFAGADVTETNLDVATGTAITMVQHSTTPSTGAGGPTLTLTSCTPSIVTASALNGVTLTGAFFETGATVAIGGTTAPTVMVASPSMAIVTTPAKAAGTYAITLTNPDGSSVTLASGITFA